MFASLILATSCKSSSKTNVCHDYQVDGGCTYNDLARVEAKIEAGLEPCPELASPSVELSDRGLALNGVVIALRLDLPTSTGGRVDALFERLKSDRYLWRRLHQNQVDTTQLEVTFPADIDAVPGASVLRTATYAGYRHLQVHVGRSSVALDYWAPLPKMDEPICRHMMEAVWIEWRADGALNVLLHSDRFITDDFHGTSSRYQPIDGNPSVIQLPNLAAVAQWVTTFCECRDRGVIVPNYGFACAAVVLVQENGGKLVTLVEHASAFLSEMHTTKPINIDFEVPGLRWALEVAPVAPKAF